MNSPAIPSGSTIIEKELRPTSVIDERNDVAGSISILGAGDEDSMYLNSEMTFDDNDTHDELDISTNSRTLIWPSRQSSRPLWKDEPIDDDARTQLSVDTPATIPTIHSFINDSASIDSDVDFRTNDEVGSNWADKRFGHSQANEFHNHISVSRSNQNAVECLESLSNQDVRVSEAGSHRTIAD